MYVAPSAWTEITDLPGYVRQRVKRAIDALARRPRPQGSKRLSAAKPSMSCAGFGWTGGESCTLSRKRTRQSTFWPSAADLLTTTATWKPW